MLWSVVKSWLIQWRNSLTVSVFKMNSCLGQHNVNWMYMRLLWWYNTRKNHQWLTTVGCWGELRKGSFPFLPKSRKCLLSTKNKKNKIILLLTCHRMHINIESLLGLGSYSRDWRRNDWCWAQHYTEWCITVYSIVTAVSRSTATIIAIKLILELIFIEIILTVNTELSYLILTMRLV